MTKPAAPAMQMAVISGMPWGRIHAQNQPAMPLAVYTCASAPSIRPLKKSINAVPTPTVMPSAKARKATSMLWVKRKVENAACSWADIPSPEASSAARSVGSRLRCCSGTR